MWSDAAAWVILIHSGTTDWLDLVGNKFFSLGWMVFFAIVVMSYPSYADNDLAVVAVVAGLLSAGLGAIILSGRRGPGRPESP